MLNKKKSILLLGISLIVVLLGAFLVYKLAFVHSEESKLIDIKVSDLETKVNNKDDFVLVISQTGCSHCEQYLPELERTLKAVNFNAYVLNITGISSEDAQTLSKYANFSGTPTTIFFNEGVEKTTLNRIIGYASQAKITERLKSLGYID